MSVSYIAVEGQHDAAFVGRLLNLGGFAPVGKRSQVGDEFARYLPKPNQENLFGRPPDCYFWRRGNHTVGVHPVGGDSQLSLAGATAVEQIDGSLFAIGFLIDADDQTPSTRQEVLWTNIKSKNPDPGFELGSVPGAVVEGAPRCGVFVFPNNSDHGAIEAVLESCAQTAYPDLFTKSQGYLQNIDRSQLSESERTRLTTGSNEKKARLSVVGSVLRPAAAIQNTIRDDRWLGTATIDLPLVANLRAFLRDLLTETSI